MDILFFLNTVKCNSCKYNILCPHITKKERITYVCYYWLNQNENYPRQEEKITSVTLETIKIGDEVFYENQFGVRYDCVVKEITDKSIILDNNALVDFKGELMNVTPRTLVFRR